MKSAPLFRFTMEATPKDPTGYCFPRWDNAFDMEVVGATRQEAMEKGRLALGENDRGWPWAFRFGRIVEIQEDEA